MRSMLAMKWRGAVVAAVLNTVAASAMAQAPAAPLPASIAASAISPSIAAEVATFYERRYNTPIWFRASGAGASAAAGTLAVILRRAPLDGLASGPLLAAEVEAAMLRAKSGNPAAVRAAERLLSSAWVSYVATIQAPVPGMIYGDPAVRRGVPSVDQILRKATVAPALGAHLNEVAEVNPTYSALRRAAASEAQIPGSTMAAKLAANLERARALPASGRFVVVDVPSAMLWMYEDGRPVDSMKVVVGMAEYPTPMVASVMHYATFNPYWHVPDHLVRKTVAPGVIKGGPAYLKARGYEVIAEWSETAAIVPPGQVNWKAVAAGTESVKVRQLPGGANSMGKVKFPFPNGEGIYLHDTPNKEKFALARRNVSNGCIRVEDAGRLARWLFGHEPAALTSKAPEQHVPLGRGVPVYVTYLTVQAEAGKLVVLDDIYGKDGATAPRTAAIR